MMGCDKTGQTVILVVGCRLELPWHFADDELGPCTWCGGLVRYRPRGPAPGVLVCPGCFGPRAVPGDVWIMPHELVAARQAAAS